MKYERERIKTNRLEVSYYRMGTVGKPRLMLIHGNVSSSVFYLPIMEKLAPYFEMVAPDLRGFGHTQELPLDATLGCKEWSDDLESLRQALGWDQCSLAGWSMGGGILMQYAIDYSAFIDKLILFAPLSPFGFGGTRDNDGKLLEPLNIASGGGCANAALVAALSEGDREFLGNMIATLYYKPTNKVDPLWLEAFIDATLTVKLGESLYPGDFESVPEWPCVSAGVKGICNTMAPEYCNLSAFAKIPNRPPVLWFQGDSDMIVSDTSYCDFGYLGQIGAVPGWPGLEAFPPQPMVSQMRYVLDQGGNYKEVAVMDAGHVCFLEQEDICVKEIVAFYS